MKVSSLWRFMGTEANKRTSQWGRHCWGSRTYAAGCHMGIFRIKTMCTNTYISKHVIYLSTLLPCFLNLYSFFSPDFSDQNDQSWTLTLGLPKSLMSVTLSHSVWPVFMVQGAELKTVCVSVAVQEPPCSWHSWSMGWRGGGTPETQWKWESVERGKLCLFEPLGYSWPLELWQCKRTGFSKLLECPRADFCKSDIKKFLNDENAIKTKTKTSWQPQEWWEEYFRRRLEPIWMATFLEFYKWLNS